MGKKKELILVTVSPRCDGSQSAWDVSDPDVSKEITGEKNCTILSLKRDLRRSLKDQPPAQSRLT